MTAANVRRGRLELARRALQTVDLAQEEKYAHDAAERTQLTDLGNAERFVAQHGDRVRYVPQWDEYLVLQGACWKRDRVGAAYQLVCETVRSLWSEAAEAKDSTERAAIAKHAKESEREPRISAILKIAKTDPKIVVEPEKLDADPWLLGVSNGVVDLRTGELRAMQPEDLITKLAGASFAPEAPALGWRSYLSRILAGDVELERFLQRAVGYTLTGNTSEQAFFFLYGLGANGKSVFLTMLRWLLGDYSVSADSSTFLARQHDGGPRPDLARLEGARLVTTLEAGENRRLDEELMKKITGGDVLTARQLYKKDREFVPTFKLLFAANHKPVIRGTDLAIWRRVQLIPFLVTIPEDERNPHLSEELKGELAGILAWAVEGCLLWQEYGLQPPQAVRAAVNEYRVESDTIARFLEECFETDETAITSAKAVYAAYTRWAESVGEHRVSANALGRKLTEKGIPSKNLGAAQTAHRIGIRLRAAHSDELPLNDVGPNHGVTHAPIPEHSRGLLPFSENFSSRAREESLPKTPLNALESSGEGLT